MLQGLLTKPFNSDVCFNRRCIFAGILLIVGSLLTSGTAGLGQDHKGIKMRETE